MAVVIRLRKMGTKKKIKHRIIVCDSKSPRDGSFIEQIGFWDPSKEPPHVSINKERALHWIKNGAKPSETVGRILHKGGVSSSR